MRRLGASPPYCQLVFQLSNPYSGIYSLIEILFCGEYATFSDSVRCKTCVDPDHRELVKLQSRDTIDDCNDRLCQSGA
jgi:hypothetical protein